MTQPVHRIWVWLTAIVVFLVTFPFAFTFGVGFFATGCDGVCFGNLHYSLAFGVVVSLAIGLFCGFLVGRYAIRDANSPKS